jgi:transposase
MDEEGTWVQRCWTEPVISALTDARAAVAKARAGGVTALDGNLLGALRARYDAAVAWGIATNAHRDWPSGRHPGYTLARRLQTRAARCGALRPTSPCRSPATPPNSPSAWSSSR